MPVALIVLIVMCVAVVILYLWKKFMVGDEYDLVNTHDTTGLAIAKQEATAKTLAQMDRITMILLIVTVVYGIAIAGYYAYTALY